jgi:hypothetical protein
MMDQAYKKIAAFVLLEIAEALNEGAAGPCHYWYIKLAERLSTRARKIMEAKS